MQRLFRTFEDGKMGLREMAEGLKTGKNKKVVYLLSGIGWLVLILILVGLYFIAKMVVE